MKRFNEITIFLVLFISPLISQDVDCSSPLSTAKMDPQSYHGVGIHFSNDIEVLKENAISALALNINSKVNTSINLKVEEEIDLTKKNVWGRKNKKSSKINRENTKSTIISSEITLSEYTFSAIKECDNQYYLVASLNKEVLKNKITKKALLFINESSKLIESRSPFSTKLSDLNNLYIEMNEFSNRLQIIDIEIATTFNSSLKTLQERYKNEISSIYFDFEFYPELTHHLNNNTNLNIYVKNLYDTNFEKGAVELKFNDLSFKNSIDTKGLALISIDKNTIEDLKNFNLIYHLDNQIKNHSIYELLDIENPSFKNIANRKKLMVYNNFNCNQDVQSFLNRKVDELYRRISSNYKVAYVENLNDADLIIDLNCTRENYRKNSFDIYILQFQINGKIKAVNSVSEDEVINSPFFDEKSFISYDKAFTNMSLDVDKFFEKFYKQVDEVLF